MARERLSKWSTYAGLLTWGASGFMAQPTFGSVIYHLFIMPLFIVLLIWLAHLEGAKGS